MRLHDLQPAAGSHRDTKRLGRGNATGQGTTAGKGTKGQKARSGGLKAGFRGITNRNFRLAHRRGFTNKFKIHYQAVNVGDLAVFDSGATVDITALRQKRLAHGHDAKVKILGDGEISVPLNLVGVKASTSARQKIEQAGGTIVEAAPEESEETQQ
jgi:large subunit ribosomal protein L15